MLKIITVFIFLVLILKTFKKSFFFSINTKNFKKINFYAILSLEVIIC